MKLFSKIGSLLGAAAVLATTLTFVPSTQAAPPAPPSASSSAPVTVKSHTRTLKNGKVITVKGYIKGGKPAVKTVTVKSYTRKSKDGKVTTVKGYTRKVTTGTKPAAKPHM